MARIAAAQNPAVRSTAQRSTPSIRKAPSLDQAARGRVIKMGQQGASVAKLQRRLGIKADGHFGPETHNAVVQVQKNNHCKTDGLVGPETLSALGLNNKTSKPIARDGVDSRKQTGTRRRQTQMTGKSAQTRKPQAHTDVKPSAPKGQLGALMAGQSLLQKEPISHVEQPVAKDSKLGVADKALNTGKTAISGTKMAAKALKVALKTAGKSPQAVRFLTKLADKLGKAGAIVDAVQGSRFMLDTLGKVQKHGLINGLEHAHKQAKTGKYGSNIRNWSLVGKTIDVGLNGNSADLFKLGNEFAKGDWGFLPKVGDKLGGLAFDATRWVKKSSKKAFNSYMRWLLGRIAT